MLQFCERCGHPISQESRKLSGFRFSAAHTEYLMCYIEYLIGKLKLHYSSLHKLESSSEFRWGIEKSASNIHGIKKMKKNRENENRDLGLGGPVRDPRWSFWYCTCGRRWRVTSSGPLRCVTRGYSITARMRNQETVTLLLLGPWKNDVSQEC